MAHKTIVKTFIDNARSFNNDTIIKYKKEPGGPYKDLAWGELRDMAFSFACGLIDLGMQPGDRLALLSFNRLEWIVTDLGTILAGGTNVALYHTNTPEQCEYIINDSGAKFAVVEDEIQLAKVLAQKSQLKGLAKVIVIAGPVPDGDDEIISYETLLAKGAALRSEHEAEIERRSGRVDPDDMAAIVYTSGTTGPPKGCMISHRNLACVLDSIHQLFQLDPQTNLSLMILPLSHLYPRVSSYYYNISMNIPLAIAESLDTLGSNMVEAHPTFIASVPRVFEKVYARIVTSVEKGSAFKRLIFGWAVGVGKQRSRKLNAHQPLSSLLKLKFNIADKLVFTKIREMLGGRLLFAVSAGAPLSAEIGEFMHSIGIQILEFYALTETISGTMTTFEHCRYGTVGKPMPGVEVKLATDGEILIRGNNFMGYFNKAELTAELLKDGWICTGDVGRWDDGGFLVITDRKKDLIITSGGKNISPQNIENMFKGMPLFSNVMVHGDRRKYLTALVTLNRAETEALAQERRMSYETYEELTQSPEIRDRIRKYMDEVNNKLARYETIKKFIILPREFSQEEGEITPTLKLKRKSIRDRYGDLLDSLYEKDA
ncbi:MAG: long-chain fatty acid--CoA ligase [Desulfomonile tiedjei]|nr:long-chain fatty acid--CoA ligase [Desulfomonile tiedjei]